MTYTTDGLSNAGSGAGRTTRYQFDYDSALDAFSNPGAPEPARTNAVIASCEGDFNLIARWFGGISVGVNLPITVHVTTGSGGASWSLSNGNAVITVNPGNNDATFIRYLLVAELTELFMLAQGEGWFGNGTEGSEGEGLSRFLSAMFLSVNGLGFPPLGFSNSNSWMASSRADYVNNINATDDGPDAITGCALLFIYYLHSQFGYSVDQIVQAGATPLSGVYRKLTHNGNDPFPRFKEILDGLFPGVTRIPGPNLDNPFPVAWPRDGRLWHTIRRPNGSWTGLGDVNGQFAIPGPVTAVSATWSNPGETQFMFTTSDGHLWHTLRRPNGSWTGLGDVNGQFAIPGKVTSVAATWSNPGETQFMFTTIDGHLWHTMRRPNGSWTGLGDVNAQFAIPGPVTAVAATWSNPGETQFMFTTSDGHLWHTLRRPNGTWTGLGDVNGQFAIPGKVTSVSAAASNPGETQFMFTTSDGHLWHTLRRPNGSWTGLGDVNGQFAIPGKVTAVSATWSNPGETQFMFTTSDGHLWHTLRHPNGSWTGLGDVNGQFAICGTVPIVAAAHSNPEETQFLFTT